MIQVTLPIAQADIKETVDKIHHLISSLDEERRNYIFMLGAVRNFCKHEYEKGDQVNCKHCRWSSD